VDARERYGAALDRLLDHYGVEARSRFVAVDGPVERLHYLDAGQGDPVVLLHGAGTPVADWVPLLGALDGYRLVAFERPGHGLSDPFDHRGTAFREFSDQLVAAFLDALDLESAALVGNSFGGYHALAYSARHPERVDRLAVVGAPAGIERSMPLPTKLFGVRGLNRPWYRLTLPGDVDQARQFYRRINVADDEALPDVFFECYRASTSIPGRRETLLSQFEGIVGLRGGAPEFLIRDELGSIDVSTRFLWGEDDYFYPPSVGRAAASELPDAEFAAIDDAGHMPWLEPDSAVDESLAEFLSADG